jgi:hypothetical protein
MAIAFDAALDANLGNVASGSMSFTCAGTDRKLLAAVCYRGAASALTPVVTYDAVTMAEIGAPVSSTSFKLHVFHLSAPTTGAHPLAFTLSAAPGQVVFLAGLSFTGVDQGTYDATATYTAASVTSITAATDLVTVAANAWIVDFIAIREQQTITVNGSQTERTTEPSAANSGSVFATSTKGPVVVPASTSMDWTWSVAHQVVWRAVSLAPAAVAGSGHISSLAGTARGLAA